MAGGFTLSGGEPLMHDRFVVPFHQLGRYKRKQLGLAYSLEATEPPTENAVAQACRAFRAEGLTAY